MLLKFLRKKENQKKIFWALVILVVPSFIIWGTTVRSGKATANYAGKVFGQKISLPEFRQALLFTYGSAKILLGKDADRLLSNAVLEQKAWTRILIYYACLKEGLQVSDAEIIAEIKSNPLFQEKGKFDKEKYSRVVLRTYQMPERQYEEETGKSILSKKLYEKITKEVKVSDEEVKQAYKQENESGDVSYILFEPKAYLSQAQATDEESKKYYLQHRGEYLYPEQVNVEYLKLDYSALKEADLSQETLRAYYDAHQEEFRKPQVIKEGEKVENTKPEYFAFEEAKERIKDILLKEAAKNKLEALIDQLSEKAQDWKAFASAQGLTYNETGLFTQAQPVPGIPFCWQFVDTAFKLSTGQMANEAILGPQSAYIIRLKEKKAPFIQGLEEVKAKVKEKVLLENAVKLANEKAQAELKEIQEKKLSLEEAAAKLALEVKKEKGIKNTGYIKGIGPSENFAEIAFSLKPGEIGGVASTAGGSCILRLDSYQGIDENKFNAEKEKYKTLVLEDKREAVFNQWLGSLLEKAKFEDNLVNLKKTAQSR